MTGAGGRESLMDGRVALQYTTPIRRTRSHLHPRPLHEVMADPLLSGDARHTSTLLWHDLVPIAACALTIVGASRLLLPGGPAVALNQVWVGFLPVGALLAGACAGGGFSVGARLSGRRPNVRAASVARAASLLLYVGVCVPHAEAEGAAPSMAAVSLDLTGLHYLTVTGVVAYLFIILAGIGFAVGVAALTRVPRGPIHCGRCRRYLPEDSSRLASIPICSPEG